MPSAPKKKYYVVKRGPHTGVYYSWSDCQKEVSGYPGAVFKGFVTKAEAEAWYGKPIAAALKAARPALTKKCKIGRAHV